MAYREVSRVEIAEVVRRWQSGHGGHAYRYRSGCGIGRQRSTGRARRRAGGAQTPRRAGGRTRERDCVRAILTRSGDERDGHAREPAQA